MIALFFLAGSFLMGIAAVSRFLPDSSRLERVLWGPSLGSMASIWISYIIARYLHSISFAVLVLLGIAMWSIAGILFYLDREKWPAITRRLVCSRDHLLLALLIVLFGWIFCYVFYTGMFHPKENGLYLTATSWYDMPYHLALADSFLYGRNFPPLYPVF